MKALNRILLKPYNHRIFYNNRVFKLDNGTNAFLGFKEKLLRHNIQIDTIDINPKAKVVKYIYADLPYPWEIGLWLRIILNKKRNILFCLESPLVNPFNQIKLFHTFFKIVYTWNDDLVDNKKYFKVYIPQFLPLAKAWHETERPRKLLTSVISNKSTPLPFKAISPYKNDLYQEREKAVNFFEKMIPTQFSLYGKGWNQRRPFSLGDLISGPAIHASYRGRVRDKLSILSKFKFCLAFENASAPGYITEKIFDCFKAECVPIYLGAENIEKYVPENTFIDFREFNSYSELLNYLISIDDATYRGFIERAKGFLAAKATREKWAVDKFLETVVSAVTQNLK